MSKSEDNILIAAIVSLVALATDVVLVFVLKDRTSMCRWVWLPLISFVAGIVMVVAFTNKDSIAKFVFALASGIWGVIRGCMLVGAYFNASFDFLTILLFLFMFIFNAAPLIGTAKAMLGLDSKDQKSTVSATSGSNNAYVSGGHSTYVEKGILCEYFSSYCCAPQGGMYYWETGPYMSSDFGSHSNYTIKGTIGIKSQSVQAFNVTTTDMDYHLRSVHREIDSYIDEIIDKYRRRYPDDPTGFKVEIDLNLKVFD